MAPANSTRKWSARSASGRASGATYVATNGTMTEDKPSAVITGMDGLYRVDVDQLDADMMKLA